MRSSLAAVREVGAGTLQVHNSRERHTQTLNSEDPMAQRFRVNIDFNIYEYSTEVIDSAVNDGISRMAVRAWRERWGAQSFPPSGYLTAHRAGITTVETFGDGTGSVHRALAAAERQLRGLAWLDAHLRERGAITIRLWDHDGRRYLESPPGDTHTLPRLLVHDFAARGGEPTEAVGDALADIAATEAQVAAVRD